MENYNKINKLYNKDISQEDFDQAIKELNQEGIKITVRAIVAKIGGSHATISRLLREYNRKISEANLNESMPVSFKNAVLTAAVALYKDFQEKINKDRIKLQDEYDSLNSDMCHELTKAENEIFNLKQKIQEYQSLFLKKDEVIKQKDNRIAELERNLDKEQKLKTELQIKLNKDYDDKQQAILDAILKLSSIK